MAHSNELGTDCASCRVECAACGSRCNSCATHANNNKSPDQIVADSQRDFSVLLDGLDKALSDARTRLVQRRPRVLAMNETRAEITKVHNSIIESLSPDGNGLYDRVTLANEILAYRK